MKYKVYANNSGQLDIISASSVGDLTLCGATGYANAVYTLNTLCSQYVNEYADGAVSIGSTKEWLTGPINKNNINTTKSIGRLDTSSSAYPIQHGISGYPYTDTHFTTTMPLDDSGYLVETLRSE